MTDLKKQEEIRKAKQFNYAIMKIYGIFFIVIFLSGIYLQYSHTFTTSKWINKPENRADIVDDMLAKYDLIGMSAEELTSLLGEESLNSYFKEENNIVYNLGSGFLTPEGECLVITIEKGIVSGVEIKHNWS